MSASIDPRKEPGFKAKRAEERLMLLLGAILDALLAARPKQGDASGPVASPVTTTLKIRRASKAE